MPAKKTVSGKVERPRGWQNIGGGINSMYSTTDLGRIVQKAEQLFADDPELLDELAYASYKHNRQSFPDIKPERWAKIYQRAEEMEARYQAERELDRAVQIEARLRREDWRRTSPQLGAEPEDFYDA